MEWLINLVIKAVFSYVGLWLDRKRAEHLEVKVKQLESAARTHEIEERIADAARTAEAPATPSAWNAGRVAPIVLCLVMFIGGCRHYLADKWPVIDAPARPAVPAEPDVWTERECILVGYARALEAAIDAYNAEVRKHNSEHDYEK